MNLPPSLLEALKKLAESLQTYVDSKKTPSITQNLPPQPTKPMETIPEAPRAVLNPTAPYDFSTPKAACHSVRVICDEEGLTVAQKNLIAQVISCESGFNNKAKLENKKNGKTWSTDWGICQINDHYHIGPGRTFPSVEYVLERPDKVVRWMIQQYKAGRLSMWVCFTKGLYKKYSAKI